MDSEPRGLIARPGRDDYFRTPPPELPKERTLVLIKPDCFERGIVGDVIARFERSGLRIRTVTAFNPPNTETLEEHYAEHREKPFFPGLIQFMRGRLIVLMLEGDDAVAKARRLTGKTDGSEPGTIRGDYGTKGPATIVHASDSPESAERELMAWFG